MIIMGITDIHNRYRCEPALNQKLSKADLVVIGGDITHFGGYGEAKTVIDEIRRHNLQVVAVSGNCDKPGVEALLNEQGLALNGGHHEIDGFSIIGLSGSLPCPGRTPNEYSEEEAAERLERSMRDIPPDLPTILVTHQPPRDTKADQVAQGVHVGSTSIRSFILSHRPVVCITGHIHESRCVDRLGDSIIVNPGPFSMDHYTWIDLGRSPPSVEIH